MDILDRLRPVPSQAKASSKDSAATNGHTRLPAGLPPRRRPEPNRLWVLVGIAIVLASGVVTFILVEGMQTTTPVLAASADIREGDIFTTDNVEVLSVPPDLSTRALSARIVSDRPELLLGTRAPYNLPRGAILYEDLVGEIDDAGNDLAIVGAALGPGQFPTFEMFVGDRLSLVRVGSQAAAGRGGKFGEATIVAIERLSGNSLLISMEVTEVLVADLSQSLSQGAVRLALIDHSSGEESEEAK